MTEYVLGEALDVIRMLRGGWEPIMWHDGRVRWGLRQTDRRAALPTHTQWRDTSEGERAVLAETGGLPEFDLDGLSRAKEHGRFWSS